MRKLKSIPAIMLALILFLSTFTAFSNVSCAENSYKINGVTVAATDFSSSPGQCWKYANNLYNKVWGYNFTSYRTTDDNLLKGYSASDLTLTEAHLKAYVSAAPVGSVLRVTNSTYLNANDGAGHSMFIVSIDSQGFTVLQGGLNASPYRAETYYTWSGFMNTKWLGGKWEYIKYIKCPETKLTNSSTSGQTASTTLDTPAISSVENTISGVKISWGSVSGAEQYRVFYKAPGFSDWKRLTNTSQTSYTWTGAESGTTYRFTVRCIDSDGKYVSAYDKTGKSITYLSAPVITSVENTSDGISIRWNPVNGAVNYRAFYRVAGTSWKRITTTTASSCTWDGAVSGTKYIFTVRCCNAAGTAYTSAYDTVGVTLKAQ